MDYRTANPFHTLMNCCKDYVKQHAYIRLKRYYNGCTVPVEEVAMSIPKTLFISAFAAAVILSGCKKAEAPPTPTTMQSPPTTGSVAVPDSKLPASDAALPAQDPSTATHANGDANAPAQNNPKELGKNEESTAMPLSGQANNHSTANPTDDKKN